MNILTSIMSLFAGLDSSNNITVPVFHGVGKSKGRISKTRNVNKNGNQKWDFRHRTGNGFGVFCNRTTGEYKTFKIANPKSTKRDPLRELSSKAQVHFGLAKFNMNGQLEKA